MNESGFNLHTSTKYEHESVNVYLVLYRPSSKSLNISLCFVLSLDALKYFNVYVEVGISKIGNCLKRSLKSIQTSYGVYALKQIN